MRKILICVLAVILLISNMPVFAAQGRKGASDRALERASDEAIFHRVGDWFATRGKSEEEKEAIIAERKAKRAQAKAEKIAAKQKKKMEKKAEKVQEEMDKGIKGMKKDLR